MFVASMENSQDLQVTRTIGFAECLPNMETHDKFYVGAGSNT